MSPPTHSSRRRKPWGASSPVLSDGFRYPLPLGSAFGSEKSSGRKQQLMQTKRPETLRFRVFLARREGFEPPAFWSVGCLKGKSESFRLRFVLLPPFARRIFHCFRPALPAPILFWVKSGSEAVISGGTGELQPCATVHTIYPHTTNGVKASVSWVYLSITAVASASVTE